MTLFLLACYAASAATHTVNPRQSTSTIQRVISGASPGDTVSFAAGTYNISGVLKLVCGVTYTAAVPATPSNVILNGIFPEESDDIFLLERGCKQLTTVSYLSSLHAGMLYVNTPNYGLTFTHNQVGDLKCCRNSPASPALYFASGDGSPKSMLSMATVTWNQLGDSTSCTAPMNAMTDYDSPENYQGACAGIIIQTSVNGMIIENNIISHVGEGIHVVCSGPCYPNAFTTKNLTVRFNDFNQIHRMAWEQQPQTTSGIDFEYNSMHDWVNGYFGSFGMSFACCGQGATSPYLNASNNVIVFNVTPHYEKPYGYGFASEDMGLHAIYNHNWIGSGDFYLGAPGMVWGYGPVGDMSYNTVCGNGFSVGGGFIKNEFDYAVGPTQIGNVFAKSCSPVRSVAPTISPSSGPQKFPLTATLTDPGYTSGPQPLANTGIWYTTDGSTPVPGAGTAQYLASGGHFVLKAPATVKAVGMWGAQNQPTSYANGFGFVPSAVKSANYTSQ
jgi:hypothetical protein